MLRNLSRAGYRALAWLFLAGVVVEFFLAGLGVFHTERDATKAGTNLTKTGFDHLFNSHLVLGDILFAVSLGLVLAAAAGRIGRRGVLTTIGLLLLLTVQATFASAGPPVVRALHPLVGLLILGTAVHIARASRLRNREPAMTGRLGEQGESHGGR